MNAGLTEFIRERGAGPRRALEALYDDIHLLRPPRRHLISIGDLTRDDVTRLLSTARNF